MNIFEKLFGSAAKVRLMKLFLFHPSSSFDMEAIKKRTQLSAPKIQKEIKALEKIDFLKKKNIFLDSKNGKNKKKVNGWYVNTKFPYFNNLQGMLIHTTPFASKEIVKKFKNTGDLKLLVISGIFIQNWESRVDLLLVGDKLKNSTLSSVIRTLEADIGCELRYTVMETDDFKYRLNIYDKLIRDILDFPHEKVLNKIDV